MKVQKIPGTGLNPSCICLGTAEMGTVMDGEDSFRMLDFFAERGGNFLDSAHVYGDMSSPERGMSEKTIGRWLRARGCRSRMIVATKGAHPALQAMNVPRLSRPEILCDLQESLENLGTDCIDLYWLHRDDPNRGVAEIIETLNEQVKAGLIRHYGLSNWQLPRFRAAVAHARNHGLAEPVASQILWSLAKPNHGVITDPMIAVMDRATWEYHNSQGIAVIPFTAQARGYFTKLRLGLPMQDWVRATYESPGNLERFRRATCLAMELNTTVEAVALAYLINQPFPAIPIISSRDTGQLEASLAASDLTLPAGTISYLNLEL